MEKSWFFTHPAEIIVCDSAGTILFMNQTAIHLYERDGGEDLIGKNVFEHHVEPVRSQVRAVVNSQRFTVYTTEKAGVKKLVTIAPWYEKQVYGGFILMVIDLPATVPNIVKE